jgi:hypothetical protein
MFLDLEVDRVADADAVTQPVVVYVDPCSLDAKHLTDESSKRGHRAAELAAEDLRERLSLLVCRLLVDEHSEPPVPVGHDLWRVRNSCNLEPADVRASI